MNIKEVGDNFTCDCGFSWQRGRSGKHECADGLRAKLAAALRREDSLKASTDVLASRIAELQPIGCIKTICGNKTLQWWRDAPEGAEVFTIPPVPAVPDDYFSTLVNVARLAADKAMRKHPQPNYVLLKVAEEAGEVIQAGVHYAEGRMTWQDLEGEIVQLLAMLIRLVTEGDQVNGIKPPASCSTTALTAAQDEIEIFVDQVCGNLPAGHQQ